MSFVGLFVIAVVVLISLLIGFHFINGIFSRKLHSDENAPLPDERDKKIESWSAQISGGLLGFLVMVWCLNAMFGIPIAACMNAAESANATSGSQLSNFTIPAFQALVWVHALFAAFVVANLAYYSLIILAYRRSA